MPLPISATIITKNEAHQIGATIAALGFVDEVIVVDSMSSDGTAEIAKKLGARVLSQPFLGYGATKNFAQTQAKNDWILNIDADEVVSQELQNAIRAEFHSKFSSSQFAAFEIDRLNYYLGQPIKHGGWAPNWLPRLYNRNHCLWTTPAIHEVLQVNGKRKRITGILHHYTFRSLQQHYTTNMKYAEIGAISIPQSSMNYIYLLIKPLAKFLSTYIFRLGFLDGVRGLIISINAAHSQFCKYSFALLHPTNKKELPNEP